MGLAGASSRALPASVTSTPATAPPMSSVSTVKGDSQSPVLRPSSQMTTRKRRRSGTASSTEQPPHTSLANSSSAASASAEPEKKKQRLEGSPGREGSVAMQTNGARRPSLEDDEEVDQLQREGSEKMQEDPRSPNGAHHDAGGPNGDKAGSPPSFRRTSTQQSSSMEMSNGPPSTGSQETMRHQSRSPTTPVGAKGPMVTSSSPPEKASEERESSRRSASHSHSRSNSMMNGTKASASPVS
ncbi:hypothetical protein M408DRAFT_326655 [Serendipita vermifera MAFF 305830]|uniref:Uncharacterized protein n=1 Tax=Serendipita vermifera MAFF 305830 TaxID=933852 RepID=A0A0C3BND7_SERVB|nr:hypothetical protein M408DRAFT_326655 [Serendipita vermifera MAFF 305830]